MAIYRGVGGSGESTTNTIVNLVAQYTFDAEAAKIAATAEAANAAASAANAAASAASITGDAASAEAAAAEAAASASAAAASAAAADTFDPDNFYTKTEADSLLDDKADQATTYTKTEADSLLAAKANQSTTYTKTEVDNSLATKQATLVSGTNIKTVNGGSLLGSGDLTIEGVPSGSVIYVAMNTAPTGYLKANGAAVSRTTYAALFAAIGTTFGVGDGSTTFNVPELRGEFIRSWADGRAVDTGRTFGSSQGEAIQSHNHSGSTNTTGNHAHTVGISATAGGFNGYALGGLNFSTTIGTGGAGDHSHSLSINNAGGPETRPRNVALLACIKF
jgi:microcystin-dependent protein